MALHRHEHLHPLQACLALFLLMIDVRQTKNFAIIHWISSSNGQRFLGDRGTVFVLFYATCLDNIKVRTVLRQWGDLDVHVPKPFFSSFSRMACPAILLRYKIIVLVFTRTIDYKDLSTWHKNIFQNFLIFWRINYAFYHLILFWAYFGHTPSNHNAFRKFHCPFEAIFIK